MDIAVKHDTPTDERFDWVTVFANMMEFGAAVINAKLDIVHETEIFSRLMELDDLPPQATFYGLVCQLAERGDFGDNDLEAIKTTILRALDNQISGAAAEPFSLDIITPSQTPLSLHMQTLPGQQVLIAVRTAAAAEPSHTHMPYAMELGESGYWTYEIATGKFEIFASHLAPHEPDGFEFDGTPESLWSVIHREDVAKMRAAFNAVKNTKRRTDISIRIKSRMDKPIWLRTKIVPKLDNFGNVEMLICQFSDATQTLRVQNKLRLSVEQAEKQLKAKNSFLARLSHEVRTPMNAVIGISDALIHHHGDPVILPKLELIQSSAEKIIRIVDETLQHAKLDEDRLELNPRQASPRKSIETVCQLWESRAVKEEIELSCQIDSSVPDSMIFDDYRYEQCVNNLLSNAVKFTRGGKIQLILTTLEKSGGTQLVLAVKDNGIGMNPNQKGSIFDAYTQADKSIPGRFGGTGLGMHITKRIIELMGGRITVKSVEGAGSIFALTLPVETVTEVRKSSHMGDLVDNLLEDAAIEKSDYSELRILVADDNPTNHMVVSSLLKSVVKEIYVAENGQEAIDIIRTQPVDIVLMDIHMPVMDGIEATLSVRGSSEAWADIPIIALTADPQYQQKRLCKNIGMDSALAKPVKLTDVLGAFDDVILAQQGLESQAA